MINIVRGSRLQLWTTFLAKHCSTTAAPTATTTSAGQEQKEKHSYNSLIEQRQNEATRSVVVQVNSEKSFAELYNYCSAFGTITKAHHYSVHQDEALHYILLEFAEAGEAAAAIDSSSYNEELIGVPVRSPFLWFRAANGKQQLKSSKSSETTTPTHLQLSSIEGSNALTNSDLSALLRSAQNVNQQILLLHEHTQLNDIGVRLRFIAALQVQQALSGMFPEANAQPFGSSVNGFGKMGCDLDLILRFDREVVGTDESAANKRHRKESRLVFHTKENLTNGRSQVQRQMESIGDMLQLFLPGVSHVRRILQARVPIIKYHHEHLNLEVDLSMSNLTGFYMSELLYMFGELDPRVRPLTFAIRRWANACGLTNPSPGRWITNFSLTCLVMFFLQQLKQPILPSIGTLMKQAGREDLRITEDGINCTFVRDIDRLGFRTRNQSEVHELLLQFFEFYSQFDFHNRAISLNEGRGIAKPDHSALYIVNPLEQVLNVSKNVSHEECERLRIEVRNAAWVLESEVENQTLPFEERQKNPWGLENLLKTNEQAIVRPNMFFRPRMVEVSDLFDKMEESSGGGGKKPPNAVPYKNGSVKQQVQNIKAQAKVDLKQIKVNMSSAAVASNGDAGSAGTSPTKRRRNR